MTDNWLKPTKRGHFEPSVTIFYSQGRSVVNGGYYILKIRLSNWGTMMSDVSD